MSTDNYPRTFSSQIRAYRVYPSNVFFFAKRAVLKTGEYHLNIPQFYRGVFSHVTRLDQSRASDTI